jgi:hypothetical protein
MGKIGRAFHTTCKEHIQANRNSNCSSAYSTHILNTGHRYGTIYIVDFIRTHRKGKHHFTKMYTTNHHSG